MYTIYINSFKLKPTFPSWFDAACFINSFLSCSVLQGAWKKEVHERIGGKDTVVIWFNDASLSFFEVSIKFKA